jgi:hypothetical protein
MNLSKTLYLFVFFLFFLISSSLLYSQEVQQENTNTDSLTEVDGMIVCINEEIAKLRHTKPMCDKYGHIYGLKTSDGMIWSFMINPIGKDLRENKNYFGKEVKVWGRLFYKAKIIEVKNFKILEEH